MIPDQINGCFEIVAGLLLTLNVIRLYRDKQVHGVHIAPMAFMAIWGFWNLYFYPYIGAPWSFVGCIVVVAVNTVWVGQMVYYRKKRTRRKTWPKWNRLAPAIDQETLNEKIRREIDSMIFRPPIKK